MVLLVVRFYLGTHETVWLERAGFDLFISHRRLKKRKQLPRAIAPWALDSGGFTEVSQFGGWQTTLPEYVDAVQTYQAEIGMLEWAAPMDWMCEPWVLEQTGLTVDEHQHRTVDNFIALREAAPHAPFVPVLQGWEHDDYLHCVELYTSAGVELTEAPLVGVGTVCRRQSTGQIERIMRDLADVGLRLHGFGVKMLGLELYAHHLTSSDSLAWSFNARKNPPLPECRHGRDGTGRCGNCIRWATRWRERLLTQLAEGAQRRVWEEDVLSLWEQDA